MVETETKNDTQKVRKSTKSLMLRHVVHVKPSDVMIIGLYSDILRIYIWTDNVKTSFIMVMATTQGYSTLQCHDPSFLL